MTGDDLTATRERLGMTRQAFAQELQLDRMTLRRYESGEREIPRSIALACAALLYGLPPVGSDRSSS